MMENIKMIEDVLKGIYGIIVGLALLTTLLFGSLWLAATSVKAFFGLF